MRQDGQVTLDMADLAQKLPSRLVDESGWAPFVEMLPPVLVLGAMDDLMVDQRALEETAAFFGLFQEKDGNKNIAKSRLVVLKDSGHDSMLGYHWNAAADAIHSFWSATTTAKNKDVTDVMK